MSNARTTDARSQMRRAERVTARGVTGLGLRPDSPANAEIVRRRVPVGERHRRALSASSAIGRIAAEIVIAGDGGAGCAHVVALAGGPHAVAYDRDARLSRGAVLITIAEGAQRELGSAHRQSVGSWLTGGGSIRADLAKLERAALTASTMDE